MLPLHFECDGAAGATTIADAKANVEAISDLKLTVIDPVAPAPIGKPVTYELVIVNRGSKPATGVKILAQFSNGIEPTEAEGHKHHIVRGRWFSSRSFRLNRPRTQDSDHRYGIRSGRASFSSGGDER